MNWDQIEGQWHQVAGKARTQWAKLTEDDLKGVAGRREQLAGKLQEHYGILKEEAEKQIDAWSSQLEHAKDAKP